MHTTREEKHLQFRQVEALQTTIITGSAKNKHLCNIGTNVTEVSNHFLIELKAQAHSTS